MTKLSILICTLPDRSIFLDRLLAILLPQVDKYGEEVEIRINPAPKEMPTGTKRNIMKDNCNGEYFGFLDCDDLVSYDYVDLIMEGVNKGVDVITFQGNMTSDGKHQADWTIKLGENYEARKDANGIEHYYRFPNHLTYMKKELVKDIRFDDIWQGEDYNFALAVRAKNVLKTEHHIPKQIYFYLFRSKK